MLVLHGTGDGVIPVSHGRALGQHFADATYVEVPSTQHGESLPVGEPAARAAYEALLAEVAGD